MMGQLCCRVTSQFDNFIVKVMWYFQAIKIDFKNKLLKNTYYSIS
jgi:hypothetical protein